MKESLIALLVFAVIFAAMVTWPGCISSGGGPEDGYTVYPKSYDREVRAAMRESKDALARHGYRCDGYGIGLVSVVPGTRKVNGYWCVEMGGVWGRSLVVETGAGRGIVRAVVTDSLGAEHEVHPVALPRAVLAGVERGFHNKRQIWCVVPPAGQPDAGVLAPRIPRHEGGHGILTKCGVESTDEQHAIMRQAGIF